MLAERTRRIAVSPTMKVTAEALKLKAQGVDVIDFGAGEPDFPTPTHISAAAHAAIDQNFTKYTADSGIAELQARDLRHAIGRLRRRLRQAKMIITAGGKQALYNTALRAVRRGRRGHHARAGLADARRADQARGRDARCSCTRTRKKASRSAPRRFSRPSPRARAASSSTRRATRPAR